MSVAWILQIRFLSGIVMREQTSIRSQNNSHSVCYWTAKGSSRQKQPLAGLAAPFRQPQHPPPPAVQWHTVMEKNYLSPVVVWLQISCSVCGPVWFLCTEAWIPNVAMSCLHSATAKRSESQTAHHWMLLLSSVPFASDIFIFPMEWPTWFTPSLRGGMRSLMRSRPLASSKLVILCCGENPRMAKGRKCTNKLGKYVPHTILYPNFSFFFFQTKPLAFRVTGNLKVHCGLISSNTESMAAMCAVCFRMSHFALTCTGLQDRHFKDRVCHLHLCKTKTLKMQKGEGYF